MLNANKFKMVKATDFKFDGHFSRDSPDVIDPKTFSKMGRGQGYDHLKFFLKMGVDRVT